MFGPNGSSSPKPQWRSRREHSAAGDGGIVLAYYDRVTSASEVGTHLIDSVTLGFRIKSHNAILDPTLARSRALFLLLAGLSLADPSRITVRLPASARKPGRAVSAPLTHEHSPLDPTVIVNQNLVPSLVETGTFASHGQFRATLAVTGLKDKTTILVSELFTLDRFRLPIAHVIIGGGGLILVEDPTHPRNTQDRRQTLDFLPILASQGLAAILATADSAAAVQAGHAILSTNGRLSADLVRPKEEELRQALGDGVEDLITLLGPIPLAPACIENGDSTSTPDASLFPAEDEGLVSEVDQGTHIRDLAFSKAPERSETRPQETLEILETLRTLETLETPETVQESKAETTPGKAVIHDASPGDIPCHDTAPAQGEGNTATPFTLPSSATPLRRRPSFYSLMTVMATPAERIPVHAKARESLPSNAEQASKTPHEDSADMSAEVYGTAPLVPLSLAEVIAVPQADAPPGDSNTSEDVQLNASSSETDAPLGFEEVPSEPEEPTQIAPTPIGNKTPGTSESDSTPQPNPVLADLRASGSLLASSYSEAHPDTVESEEEPARTSFENKLPTPAECPILDDESDPIT